MLTIGVKPKISSDLDVGRRPELKSDEFFCFTPIVHEIWPPQLFTFSKKVSSISDLYTPGRPNRRRCEHRLGASGLPLPSGYQTARRRVPTRREAETAIRRPSGGCVKYATPIFHARRRAPRPPVAGGLAAMSRRFHALLPPGSPLSPPEVYESIAAPKSNFHSLKALGSSRGRGSRERHHRV